MTGIVTASWISRILVGSAMRATPPSRRMSAGTRSSAITAHAPASSAIRACSALVTSMITPPLSISARPLLTRMVPVSATAASALGKFWRQCSEAAAAARRSGGGLERFQAVHVEHPDQALTHVDQAAVAQLVQHLGQRLTAGADHLGQLHVREPLIDADAVGRDPAVAVHQLQQLAGQP